MNDASEAVSPVPDSFSPAAENATGAYGVLEKPDFTDTLRKALASGTP